MLDHRGPPQFDYGNSIVASSPFQKRRSLGNSILRRHLTHEVALADPYAETAENVVGRRDVEIEVRHREMIEVGLGTEGARLTTRGNRDLCVLLAVELLRPQGLEEVDRLVDPGLHLFEAVVDGG